MRRRVVLRAGALAVAAVAVIAALTVYFSTQKTPPCFATGIPKWQPPQDNQLHRFEVVVPDRWLCFFDMDHDNALVGYVKLAGIDGISSIAVRDRKVTLRYRGGRGALVDLETSRVSYDVRPPPPQSDGLKTAYGGVTYVTSRGKFGVDAVSGDSTTKLSFPGYTWNPRFGPDPPNHGLAVAPDKPELWVLDAPNNAIHIFGVSGAPRMIKTLRLTQPLIGTENPCVARRCTRIGSLQFSADGRFVYVGDAGDVFDAKKREQITNLEALHESRLMLEVDWANGKPEFPAAR